MLRTIVVLTLVLAGCGDDWVTPQVCAWNCTPETDGGVAGSVGGVIVKENGTVRGTATTLDFSGASVSFAGGVATIAGLLDSIGIKHTGVNVGDVQNFDFHGFDLAVEGDTVRVMAPDLSTFATKTYVDDAIASVGGSGGTYTLPTASTVTKGAELS